MEDHQHQPQPIVEKEETEANIVSPANVDDYFESFPPGYRFNPYDGELIVHYLKKKINEETLPPNRIHDVNIYKFNPETLSERYTTHGENEWYFFTPRDRKYRNGKRPNRAAGDGYWKATGTDKTVKFKGVNVGLRTALVFYKGRPPKGEKTNWIMHEFRVLNSPPKPPTTVGNDMRLDDCVLCKIYKNVDRSRIIRNRHPNDDEEVPSPALQYYNEHLPPENSAILTHEASASVIPNEAMEMDNGCYNGNVDPNPMAFSQPSDFSTFHYGFEEFDMGYFDQWEWLTQ